MLTICSILYYCFATNQPHPIEETPTPWETQSSWRGAPVKSETHVSVSKIRLNVEPLRGQEARMVAAESLAQGVLVR